MRQKSEGLGARSRPGDLALDAGTPAGVVDRCSARPCGVGTRSSPRFTRPLADRAQ
jgi:hypothetical protein